MGHTHKTKAVGALEGTDRDSHVVTHHTTNLPACGLRAARSRVGATPGELRVRPLYSRATWVSLV
jgi:hypothetical protein